MTGSPQDLKRGDQGIQGKPSSDPDLDKFWKEYGKKLVKNTISGLDEKAKNMITTCAGLIIVNLGLLLAFNTQQTVIKITPQLFFAISAAFFAISYFPSTKLVNLASTETIESAHRSWHDSKIRWHKIGYILFIIGLFAAAITSLKIIS